MIGSKLVYLVADHFKRRMVILWCMSSHESIVEFLAIGLRFWMHMKHWGYSARVGIRLWMGLVHGELLPDDAYWWLGCTGKSSPDLMIIEDEIRFGSFVILLAEAIRFGDTPSEGNACFIDIGSGTGKAMLAASLFLTDWISLDLDSKSMLDLVTRKVCGAHSFAFFKSCTGVELDSLLASRACMAIDKLRKMPMEEGMSGAMVAPKIDVVRIGVFDVDLSNQNVVYVDGTSMGDALLAGIVELAEDLPAGSVLIMLLDSSPMHFVHEYTLELIFVKKTFPSGWLHGSPASVLLLRRK